MNQKALLLTIIMYVVVFVAGRTISDTYLSGWIAAAIGFALSHKWKALKG